MPIKIPNELPARATLEAEGVMLMREADAVRQDIRPMRIGLLNLMPNKIRTETQFARLLGSTPLQVELTLVKMTKHIARNTPSDHIISFYRDFEDIRAEKFDGFIVTGAPVETDAVRGGDLLGRTVRGVRLDAHQRAFDLQRLLGRAGGRASFPRHAEVSACRRRRSASTATAIWRRPRLICAAFPTTSRFRSRAGPRCAAMTFRPASGLQVLMESDETGLCMLHDPAHRALHMFNHIEYDSSSLADEYFRDVAAGKPIALPGHYFPKNDPTRQPENRWRSHAHLLFGNWINELYQTTPFDVEKIGASPACDWQGRGVARLRRYRLRLERSTDVTHARM